VNSNTLKCVLELIHSAHGYKTNKSFTQPLSMKPDRRVAWSLVLWYCCHLISVTAQPTCLYGVGQDLNTQNLYLVNLLDGVVTLVGNPGVAFLNLAFSATNTLYGITANDLYIISQDDAAPTLIGPFGNAIQLRSISFEGPTLLGVNSNKIYNINIATGAATPLLNITPALNPVDSSAYVPSLNSLLIYTAPPGLQFELVSLTTGTATIISSFPNQVGGMGLACNGQIYGLSSTVNGPSSIGQLGVITATTGTFSAIGAIQPVEWYNFAPYQSKAVKQNTCLYSVCKTRCFI